MSWDEGTMMTRRHSVAFWLAIVCMAAPAWADPLNGTQPLTIEQPLDVIMVDGIDRFALREIAASVDGREKFWKRDFSSPAAYETSVAPNREHLRTILGVVDPRVEARAI